MQAFSKLTEMVDGERRITADPPLIVPIEDVVAGAPAAAGFEDELRGLIRSYRRTLETDRRVLLEDFEYVHAARKVVGVGSVGTRAWILLMLGRDGQDPLFLQAKEAEESVLERCPVRRPDRDRGIPREERHLRPGHRRLRTCLRRPERTRLPSRGQRREVRQARSAVRAVDDLQAKVRDLPKHALQCRVVGDLTEPDESTVAGPARSVSATR